MDLFYYRGSKPNFGDELNRWMWPKLIEGVWDDLDNTTFIGIGSVITNKFPADKTKIIFGAGYGGHISLPKIDEKWKILFVRGKETAKVLGLDESLAIGDSAILLRSLIGSKVDIKYKVSYMPHWKSIEHGNWESAAKLAGINYIDPTQNVEMIIEQILSSELILAEAMHGAIVADALRVPWIPIATIDFKNQMKWLDWASALNLNLNPQKLVASSMVEKIAEYAEILNPDNGKKIRKKLQFLKHVNSSTFAEKASNHLLKIAKATPSLSDEKVITSAHEQMEEKLYELVKFIGKGKVLL